MIHRLVFIVWLIVVVSAKPYNISIAPLVEAIERTDALYREWRAILDEMQAQIQHRQFHLNSPDVFERAVVAMWKDREPRHEIAVAMDPHMKTLLLDEIIALIKIKRPDLVLRGSKWSHPRGDCPGLAYCADERRSSIGITRVPDTVPPREAPFGQPFVLFSFTDEEMRARWHCSTNAWNWDEEDCDYWHDAPPVATTTPPQ